MSRLTYPQKLYLMNKHKEKKSCREHFILLPDLNLSKFPIDVSKICYECGWNVSA